MHMHGNTNVDLVGICLDVYVYMRKNMYVNVFSAGVWIQDFATFGVKDVEGCLQSAVIFRVTGSHLLLFSSCCV